MTEPGITDPGVTGHDETVVFPAISADTTMDQPQLVASQQAETAWPTSRPPQPAWAEIAWSGPTQALRPVSPDLPGRAGPPDQTALTDVPTETGSVARNGALMAAGSLVSRLTGLVRTVAIGAALGAAALSDDFNLANTLPGMVYELLLGGVLASVVVPLLVRARTRDIDKGVAYTQRLLTLASIFLAGATVVAVICAPFFTWLVTNATTPAADRHLVTTLAYLLLPMIFFYGMAALFAAVLNTNGHFAAPMWTPILNNIVVITMAVGFTTTVALKPPTAVDISGLQIAILGLGTTAGIVVQALGLWPALRRVGFRWRWRWDLRELHLRELGRMSAWMLCYVAVSQAGVVGILNIAKRAADQVPGAAGPAIFNNAYLVFMMAHGIIAVSIITALLPRMSHAAATNRPADLADQLSVGTRLAAVVLVPATVGYVVLGRPLALTLFQFGNYTQDQATTTGWVIAVAGLGLVPFAISQLQLFAFYAMADTKTPAVVNAPVVAVRIGVDVVLFLLLPAAWVAAGLMAGNAISFVVASALGYWLLHRRIGGLGLRAVFATIGKLAVAALIGGAAASGALLVLARAGTLGSSPKMTSVVGLTAGGVILIIVYLLAATALRVAEVGQLWARLRRRSG